MTKIAIILDYETTPTYAQYPWYALRTNYVDAVAKAGGVPYLLGYYPEYVALYQKEFDGLLIAGGDFDIPPAYYGEQATGVWQYKSNRSQFEMLMLQGMLAQNKPVFGICGGMQLINVCYGGTLIQDISITTVQHQQTKPKHLPEHIVHIQAGSLMHECSKRHDIMVNSTHHQGIKVIGNGLVATAIAEDGLVEAIEDPAHNFCLGVQWHPEYLTHAYDFALFKAFVAKAAFVN